ncbi:MAG: hypothetical protein IJY51_03470 [Treponema sp.]|uniref:hypothetical protein n=1 Tax=Treponema sp. TaxID=166 RepID=UPI00257CEC31|nr:hypothetical protein [Treponema sp.]MBQ9102126.1 hypothetical protein [Treponema sp.]
MQKLRNDSFDPLLTQKKFDFAEEMETASQKTVEKYNEYMKLIANSRPRTVDHGMSR